MENLVEVLRQAPLFSSLTRKEIDLLAQSATRAGLTRKETVFRPGSPMDALYLIVNGGVKVSKSSEQDIRFILDIYRPGEVIGEEGLTHSSSHDTEARPLDQATLIKLDVKALQKIMEENPRFARSCLHLIAERARLYREKVEDLIFKEVPSRLAGALIKLAKNFGRRDKQGTLIAARITHQDLADYIGASRETVSLALGQMRRKKLLKMSVRKFILPDPKALRKNTDGL
jgi:CRP-like cAMP-binding protein